jgi:hypothetical protein
MASVLGNYTYHSSCFVVGMACAIAVATAMAIGSLVDFIYSSGFYPQPSSYMMSVMGHGVAPCFLP